MKNIWKLLLIALLAFAMIGCPTTKEDDDDDDAASAANPSGGNTPSTTVPYPEITGTAYDYDPYAGIADFGTGDQKGEGVYTFTGEIANISTQWAGSSTNPQFSVLLLNEAAVEAITADPPVLGDGGFKDMPIGSPAYQLQGRGNATFVTSTSGTLQNGYKGLTATVDVDAGTYKLYIDMAQLLKGQIKALGKDYASVIGSDGNPAYEKVMTANDTLNLSDCVPYVLALDSNNAAKIGNVWGGDIIPMTLSDEDFPEVTAPEYVKCHVEFTGKMFLDDGEEATDDVTLAACVKDVHLRLFNVVYLKGEKIPFNFYCGGPCETTENATHGQILHVTLPQPTGYSRWEAAQGPASGLDYNFFKKLALAGKADQWIGFDTTDDYFNCQDIEW